MRKKLALLKMLSLTPYMVFATSTYNLPPIMKEPADKLINFLSSGIGVVIIICGVVISGITLGFSGAGEGFKKAAGWVLAGSIIMGAASLVSFFFGLTF